MRKLCPSCKHLRYRRRAAHFRDVLSALTGPLIFVTLTATAQNGSAEQAVEEIRTRFSRRFVPKLRDMMGATPHRVAQVDISPDGRVHLHAIIETALSPGAVAGAWVRSGGGIDADIQLIRPTPDDIARVVLYVLKGGLDVRTGRELTSHGIGYDSKVHKERRRARMAEGADPDLLFEPAERVHAPRTPRRRPAAPDRTATLAPLNDRALSLLAGGRHGIESTFDRATDYVTWTAVRVRGRGGSRRYVRLAACASKKHARDFLNRRDAHVRSRWMPRRITKP